MKKLILLLVLATMCFVVDAQDFVSGSYRKYAGIASDTVNGSSDAEYVTWECGMGAKPYFYTIEADIDELSGSATAYVALEASNDNSHWNLIDSLAVVNTSTEGLTADGTLILSDLSTGVSWRYMRTKLFISTTGKWDYNYVIIRLVGKND